MAKEYTSLKTAVELLRVNGLGCRLIVQHDMLKLVADLTRHDFNSGQPDPMFYVYVFDGKVISDSFECRAPGVLPAQARWQEPVRDQPVF